MIGVRVLIRLCRFAALYFTLCLAFSLVVFLIAPLLLGLTTQFLFDRLAGQHAPLTALEAVGGLVGLQILMAMASPLFGNPWSPMQQKAQALLRRNLLASIIERYGREPWTESTGDAVSRFRDDPVLIADTMDALCDLIGRTLFVICAGVVMWFISPIVVIALGVPVVVSYAISQLCRRQIGRYRLAARASTGNVTGFLGDIVGGQLAVKVAGATPHVIGRLEELGDRRRQMEVRDTVFGSILEGFNINIGNLGLGLTLLLAAPAMSRGTFTIGDLAMFAVYLDAVGWFPDEIGRLMAGLKQTEVSLERMGALTAGGDPEQLSRPAPVYLQGPWSTRSQLPARPTAMETFEIRDLTYRHPETERGIERVSFVVRRGSFTVVTGPVGSGKSTLLRVVLGLLPADSGSSLWNGLGIEDPGTFLVPPRVAYVPQIPRLFSETVEENILLGLQVSPGSMKTALRRAVLDDDVAEFEAGVQTMVGPRGVKLSGGQIQRVAAARMFVRGSEMCIVDDLSSALDVHTEAELWRRILESDRELTCLVVSHRKAVLERADQIIRLENGRTV